jgi:uncharacterized membrane protein YraQ (UPF0718 family)
MSVAHPFERGSIKLGGAVAEVGERVTRLEVIAEQTAATLARLERLVENGFAKVERDAKGNFDKLDAKIEQVRDEVLADNRNNRRLIGWTLLGFAIAALAAIWMTNQLVMQAIGLGRETSSTSLPSVPRE